jgi:hypothetical protein
MRRVKQNVQFIHLGGTTSSSAIYISVPTLICTFFGKFVISFDFFEFLTAKRMNYFSKMEKKKYNTKTVRTLPEVPPGTGYVNSTPNS